MYILSIGKLYFFAEAPPENAKKYAKIKYSLEITLILD